MDEHSPCTSRARRNECINKRNSFLCAHPNVFDQFCNRPVNRDRTGQQIEIAMACIIDFRRVFDFYPKSSSKLRNGEYTDPDAVRIRFPDILDYCRSGFIEIVGQKCRGVKEMACSHLFFILLLIDRFTRFTSPFFDEPFDDVCLLF